MNVVFHYENESRKIYPLLVKVAYFNEEWEPYYGTAKTYPTSQEARENGKHANLALFCPCCRKMGYYEDFVKDKDGNSFYISRGVAKHKEVKPLSDHYPNKNIEKMLVENGISYYESEEAVRELPLCDRDARKKYGAKISCPYCKKALNGKKIAFKTSENEFALHIAYGNGKVVVERYGVKRTASVRRERLFYKIISSKIVFNTLDGQTRFFSGNTQKGRIWTFQIRDYAMRSFLGIIAKKDAGKREEFKRAIWDAMKLAKPDFPSDYDTVRRNGFFLQNLALLNYAPCAPIKFPIIGTPPGWMNVFHAAYQNKRLARDEDSFREAVIAEVAALRIKPTKAAKKAMYENPMLIRVWKDFQRLGCKNRDIMTSALLSKNILSLSVSIRSTTYVEMNVNKQVVEFGRQVAKFKGERYMLDMFVGANRSAAGLVHGYEFQDTARMYFQLLMPEDEKKKLLRKDIYELHNVLQAEITRQRQMERDRLYSEPFKLTKKQQSLDKQYDVYDFSVMRMPRDIMNLGDFMHNCVSSYIDDVVSGRDTIVSMTDKDNTPIGCIELVNNGKKMVQCLGKYNRELTEEQKKSVIAWCNDNAITYSNCFGF